MTYGLQSASPLAMLIGYELGFYSIDDVAEWAETRLGISDPPQPVLVALANLHASEADVVVLLRQLDTDDRVHREVDLRLAFVYRMLLDGRLSLLAASEHVVHLARADALPEHEAANALRVHRELTVASTGEVDVELELAELTRPYWDRFATDDSDDRAE